MKNRRAFWPAVLIVAAGTIAAAVTAKNYPESGWAALTRIAICVGSLGVAFFLTRKDIAINKAWIAPAIILAIAALVRIDLDDDTAYLIQALAFMFGAFVVIAPYCRSNRDMVIVAFILAGGNVLAALT